MKAQAGQIFIYLLTIVLVSFILFYGYRAVTTFIEKGEQISFVEFKTNMQNTVETIAYDFGSVRIKEFQVPDNIKTVCLVRNFPDLQAISGTDYPLMEDSVNSGVDKNVFLIDNDVKKSFTVKSIDAPEDPLCVPVLGNRINLKFEGKGKYAFVTDATT